MQTPAICLMGPTAAGKTDVAIALCKRFPCEIISVDSALVYRGMDIGTAKPDAATLKRSPHRLIDIRDPEEAYSAGDFVRDAKEAIEDISAGGRIPLLVGGTMMYFRALLGGLSDLPGADAAVRAAIDARARESGWPALHAELAVVDPASANRIEPGDSQRIQRAIEVWTISGRPLSDWQNAGKESRPDPKTRYLRLALVPATRKILHERIESRLNSMIDKGFADEVRTLRARPGVTAEMPSMRAVGYRQFGAWLDGKIDFDEARYRALVATRQLAKRQLTWLRSDRSLKTFDPLEDDVIDSISAFLIRFF